MAEPPALGSLDEAVFKAYDIRGIVDEQLDCRGMYLIGRALGSEARARGIASLAVGRDGRCSSAEFSEALIEGLLACGLEVLEAGLLSSPLLYFAAYQYAGGSGAMVTASHNPPQYNGLKMVLGGETLAGAAIQRLYRRILERDFVPGAGSRRPVSVLADYRQALCRAVRLGRGFKVVVDAANGSAAESAPALLRALGCEVIELHCTVDGRFPHHAPDPSQPENLRELIATVQACGADLGLAFDGDGDRLGVVSAAGRIIWPDRLLMLFARELLAHHTGAAVVFDVKCSAGLGRLIEQAGGRAVMSASGHSLIKATMLAEDALLGGELSGHLYFRDEWYGFDDALYAAARLLRLMDRSAQGSEALFAQLPDSAVTPELRIAMPEARARALVEQLVERLPGCLQERLGDGTLCRVDGLRIDGPDGFILVRASNTTPALVLRLEGGSPTRLEELKAALGAALLELDSEMDLPF